MRKYMLVLLIILPCLCNAQVNPEPSYPDNYFRNPLDIPILLAGNFGECRSGHFHSGLDIKTQGKENLPVHAAADGYISRIKTDKGGFGHAIYIIHPNGYTTLYAHLNNYAPFLQKYLRQQQYEKKRWNIDISFPPEKFPVRKGQMIAYSGNTGSSTAPHLHFEIRNTKTEHPLNPQLFGLDVIDNMPPVAAEVVFYSGNVYDRNLASYTLKKKNNTYKPFANSNQKYKISGDTIDVPEGLVGVAINADDYMNGSDNTITFYTAKLLLDDSIQSVITLDDIGYDVSRYIHAYADFYAKQVYKKWIQCLFRVPGNKLNSLYTTINEHDGKLNITDGSIHKLNIVLTDNNGNATNIECYIRPTSVETKSKNPENCIPFYAGKTNEYSNANIQFTIDDRQLYDDICFKMETAPDAVSLSDQFRIHYPYIPLHHYFDLMIKPNKNIAFNLRDKVVLMYTDGKEEEGRSAEAVDKGWYKASVRNFGTYRLAIDTIPPRINGLQKNGADLSKAKQIAINVKDDITSVRAFSGLIDGKWVCFEQHGHNFFYVFDEHCGKGKHELMFKAEDENGNEAKYKVTFKR